MTNNQPMKRILVYGDSLPWGLVPGSTTFERFPSDIRWPKQLQNLLGSNYEVIEECLCARTIDSDDLRPGFEGRNGMSYITPCLDSHDPIDIVIVSLGLNEIKSIFEWTPKQVSEKMKKLIEVIKNRKPNFHQTTPRIILLTQPEVREGTGFWGDLWVGSGPKSIELAKEYRKLSTELNIELCDIFNVVKTGKDGVHLDESAHRQTATEVAKLFDQ